MPDFQQESGFKRVLYSRPSLVIFFVVLVFFSIGIFELVRKMRETSENREIAENKIIELQGRKDELTSSISEIETDMGKERVFRENFGLAKEGEEMIIIVDKKDDVNTEDEPSKRPFWSFWNRILGN